MHRGRAGHIHLYAGGMLAIGEPWEETQKAFREMGFDRIYPPLTLPGPVIADLEADLVKKESKKSCHKFC